jgi:hypothetical protein
MKGGSRELERETCRAVVDSDRNACLGVMDCEERVNDYKTVDKKVQ